MDAQVTAITGTVAAVTGVLHTSVAFVPNGDNPLPVSACPRARRFTP